MENISSPHDSPLVLSEIRPLSTTAQPRPRQAKDMNSQQGRVSPSSQDGGSVVVSVLSGTNGNVHNGSANPSGASARVAGDVDIPFPEAMNADLRDWLKLTGWYDIRYRIQELHRFRLVSLDQEQAALEYRRARLMIESGADGAAIREEPRSIQAAGARPSTPAQIRSVQDVRRRSISPYNSNYPPRGPRDFRIRGYSGNRRDEDRLPASDQARQDRRAGQGLSAFLERREPREDTKPHEQDQRVADRKRPKFYFPKKLRLGGAGSVRFFVMKSFTESHISDSQNDGIWATQKQNEEALRKAHAEAATVVLFFSVNRSHAFHGYAVMRSLPSENVPRPRWWNRMKWQISQPFKIDWISKATIDDSNVFHISNSLNDNLPVTRSRDGQEVEEYAGRQMVAVLESCAVQEARRVTRRD
ncbi:hypothetical protein AAE478_007329 [Parahypoxylon ruwenzoriense]